MKRYFETVHHDGGEYPIATAHDTLETAIDFADAHGIELICEIGGSFDEWQKCAFCGEWFLAYTLNEHGDCERCAVAIRDHGGY